MGSPKIQAIINQFRKENPKYFLYKDEAILNVICEASPELLKDIPNAEIEMAMKVSIFSTKSVDFYDSTGLEIEHTNIKKSTTSEQKAREIIHQKVSKGNVYRTTVQALQELGMDINAEDSQKIINRLGLIPKEIYEEYDIGERIVEILIKNNLKVNFENIADIIETMGASIRTEEERNGHTPRTDIDANYLTDKDVHDYAVEFLYEAVSVAHDTIYEYYAQTKKHFISGNRMWEGLKSMQFPLKLFENITGYNISFLDTVWDKMDKIDEIYVKVVALKNKPNPSDKEIEELFKEFTGGYEFNKENIQTFIDAQAKLSNGKIEENSKEYKEALKKAFGTKAIDSAAVQNDTKRQYKAGSVCDIVIMIAITMFLGGSPLIKGLTSGIGKRWIASALSGGLTLGSYATLKETTNLLIDKYVHGNNITSEDMKNSRNEVLSSTGFGLAGGPIGEFAVKPVTSVTGRLVFNAMQKYTPKLYAKYLAEVSNNISKGISKGTIKNGADLMVANAESPGLISKGAGLIAKGAGVLTDYTGFTVYQTIVNTSINTFAQDGNVISAIKQVLIQKAMMKGDLTEAELNETKEK